MAVRKDASVKTFSDVECSTELSAALVPSKTPNEAVAAVFINTINAGEYDDPAKFFTDDAQCVFREAQMTMVGMNEELKKLWQSFPDFRFCLHGGKVTEQADGTVVTRFNAVGTHIGPPYSFGPYPEVKTTGLRVKMDDEYVRVQYRHG